MWLRRKARKPSPQPSFRVHIKLNSYEFLRRLDKLTRITIPRSRASRLVQLLDPSYNLLRKIANIERQIRVIRRHLANREIGERRYFGDCVLSSEAVASDLRSLLCRLHEIYKARKQVPEEFFPRGEALSNRLDGLNASFVKVRRALAQESMMQRATANPSVWQRFLVWCGLAGATQAPTVDQDHKTTLHLFNSGGQYCECRLYL